MLEDDAGGEERRAAATRNFQLLALATGRLGGVPTMLDAAACCAPGGPHQHAVTGCGAHCL